MPNVRWALQTKLSECMQMDNALTQNQIVRVRASFEHVKPISNLVGTLFYQKLFELDPLLRPLFQADIHEQSDKLMEMLATAVSLLNSMDKLFCTVDALCDAHADYGFLEHHFEPVGQALIWALSQSLGSTFTAETQKSWVALYKLLADVMKKAMRAKQLHRTRLQKMPALHAAGRMSSVRSTSVWRRLRALLG